MPIELTPQDRDVLRRLKHKVDMIRGPGVVNTPDGITINPPVNAPGRPSSGTSYGKGLKYQVLMTLDDAGTVGWDYERIHA